MDITRHRLPKLRGLLALLPALFLVIAVACGTAATPTPEPPPPTNTPAAADTPAEPTAAAPANTQAPAPAGVRPTNTPVPTPTPELTRAAPAAPAGDAQAGGHMNMAAYADVETWDPLGSASLSSVQGYSQLFNQVVEYDMTQPDTSQIICDLCSDWEVSNGGKTYTFQLVENAQWGDGEPITADDVVFSLARYMNPDVPVGRSGLFRNYTVPVAEGGVRKVDDHTVEMNLAFPTGAFLQFLALDYTKVLPQHIVEQAGDMKQAETIIDNQAWSGPFKLDEYQRGNSYSVSRNENYFKEGMPYLDSIDHFIIVDTGRMISSFQAGQLDMINSGFSNLTPREYIEVERDTQGEYIAHEMPGSRNWAVMMNTKKGPFQDPKVRKAVYLAIDRQEVNQLTEDGTGAPPCVFMPGFVYSAEECSQWPGIRPKDSPGGQEDIAFAKQLMQDAGFGNGFSTTYHARQVGTYPDTCTVIKQQLEETLGITGDIQVHESAAGYALYATARQGEGDWEIACQGEGMTVLDPDAVMGGVYIKGASRNYSDWEPQIVRDLFEQQKVEQDPAQRKEILKELVQFLVPTDPNDLTKGFTNNHWVTLLWGRFFWLADKDVQGLNLPQTVQYGFKHEQLWWGDPDRR
jgi:peptide/nickel transport system substrate-binding protein